MFHLLNYSRYPKEVRKFINHHIFLFSSNNFFCCCLSMSCKSSQIKDSKHTLKIKEVNVLQFLASKLVNLSLQIGQTFQTSSNNTSGTTAIRLKCAPQILCQSAMTSNIVLLLFFRLSATQNKVFLFLASFLMLADFAES